MSIVEPRQRFLRLRGRFSYARPALLAGSILLACAAWWLSAGGVYTLPLLGTWLGSLLAWLVAWWPALAPNRLPIPGAGSRSLPSLLSLSHNGSAGWRVRASTILLLALILVVAAFFRFYRLDELPRNPTSDHAEKLLDVLDLVRGQRPIFFVRNTGREPAQFYWTLALINVFGFPLSWETLKWGTALIGLAAVPAIFLVGRELRDSATGLIAAALFAIAKWPVNISRAGLRYPLAVVPAALVVWLLLRYLRRPDRRVALLCGVVLGFGLHGYSSFRVVPLLVPLALLCACAMDRRLRHTWRACGADGLLVAATALLACLPLAHYGVAHPQEVWFRIASRAAGAERSLGGVGEQLAIFAGNNLRALLAFNLRGDISNVVGVSNDPLLDPLTGAAFVGGVALAGYWAVRRRDARLATLLLALPVLLLPSTLSIAFPIENPSANRLGVAAVVVFPLAALPIALLLRLAWPRPLTRVAGVVALAAMLLFAARSNYVRYFRDFDQQYQAFVPNTVDVAKAVDERLAAGIALDNVYLLAYPHWLDGRNLAFELGEIEWVTRHEIRIGAPLPTVKPRAAMVFLLNAADSDRLEQLRRAYPGGSEQVRVPPAGHSFMLYTVPPEVPAESFGAH